MSTGSEQNCGIEAVLMCGSTTSGPWGVGTGGERVSEGGGWGREGGRDL